MRFLDTFGKSVNLRHYLNHGVRLNGRTRLSVTCQSSDVAAMRRRILALLSVPGIEIRQIEVNPITDKALSHLCITIAYDGSQRQRLIDLAGQLASHPAARFVHFGTTPTPQRADLATA